MADKQGIKSLKLTGQNKIPIYPANWIAGVDYEQEDQNEENNDDMNDKDYSNIPPEYTFDDELDDAQAFDKINQTEIDELLAEPGQRNNNANPTNREVQ
jgi:hypothetical protein